MSTENVCKCKRNKNKRLTINIIKCYKKHLPTLKKKAENDYTLKINEINKTSPQKSNKMPQVEEENIEKLPGSDHLAEEPQQRNGLTVSGDVFEKNNEHGESNSIYSDFLESLVVDPSPNSIYTHDANTLKPTGDASRTIPKKSNKKGLKLPTLAPRYHGSGCAMEIAILEKHVEKCRYRKGMNPERNTLDDRVGSYEAIGRMVFKICDDSPPDPTVAEMQRYPHLTVFSLINSFRSPHNSTVMQLRESKSDILPQIKKRIMKNQELLDILVKNSKSFTLGPPMKNFGHNSYISTNSNCSSDTMDELFPKLLNVDRSTQTTKHKFLDIRYRWNHFVRFIKKKFKELNIYCLRI